MLELLNVLKNYYVGDQTITALKNISITFRKKEFVSILGQSGCGKTTLMNLIGGLDRVTDGQIILNGTPTSDYKETDWDDYRNSKIGLVFQNYNLIQHLDVLTNVELALTISGVAREERLERAKAALQRVGLESQYTKLPNQLSGGQMQRVAIARAIVNNPDILLADEPTGAIDSETSVQIMDILKEISLEKLVIVVTHNSELAQTYSNRIVKILDGEIISDNNPVEKADNAKSFESIDEDADEEMAIDKLDDTAGELADEGSSVDAADSVAADDEIAEVQSDERVTAADTTAPQREEIATQRDAVEEKDDTPIAIIKTKRPKRKKGATMAFGTAMKLSWKNLLCKRGRSVLTSIAGSIGIISIALVLALNNGFSLYISNFEKESMSKYPITISSGDASVLSTFEEFLGGDDLEGDSLDLSSMLSVFAGDESEREKYTEEELVYIYGQFTGVFSAMMNSVTKETKMSDFKKYLTESDDISSLATIKYDYSVNMSVYRIGTGGYRQICPLSEGVAMSSMLELISDNGGEEANEGFDIGSALDMFAFWDEIVADESTINAQYSVLAGNLPQNMNEIVLVLDEYNQISDFDLFVMDEMDIADMMVVLFDQSKLNNYTSTFEQIMQKEYYILPTSATYVYNNETSLYDNVKELGGTALSQAITNNGIKVKISGIIRPKEGIDGGCIDGVIGYSSELGSHIIQDANECDYVFAQNVEYAEYLKKVEAAAPVQQKLLAGTESSELTLEEQTLLMTAMNATVKNVCTGEGISAKEYSSLLSKANVRDLDEPSYIYIYPNAIENKNLIVNYIEAFNSNTLAAEEAADAEAEASGGVASSITQVVDYTDDLDSVVSELNTVVNTLTIILIALAFVSVIVTMLLIAIIMYISVQDRTREIGILRSLGGRRIDISNIFNVETLFLGLASGVIGVLISFGLQYPANLIFTNVLGIAGLLKMAWWHPLVLVFGAMALTVISGLIPSMLAANKDPVVALRTE